MKHKNRFAIVLLSIFFVSMVLTPVIGYGYIPEPVPPPPPPPPATAKPYEYWEVEGIYQCGNLNSFKYQDGNVISWKGEWVWQGTVSKLPVWSWEFKIDVFFYYPIDTYPNLDLIVKFKYSGYSSLRFYVMYMQGGNDVKYHSSTGGAYVLKTFELDANKHVWCIVVDTCHAYGIQQQVWIDYLAVRYS